MTNCVVGAIAGVGEDAIFGRPVSIVADLTPRVVQVPLGRVVSGAAITLVFDMEQPGRTHLDEVRLVTP